MTLDLTRPGPAGLYFRTDRLTPAGLAQDKAARARLETHCTICGSIPAPYGFGRHAACDAINCRADAEARMDADRLGEGAPALAAEPSRPAPALDLFAQEKVA